MLGNEKNLEFLRESAAAGRLSHAYIVNGQKGMGKKTFALNAAAALLCTSRRASSFYPCGKCPACRKSLSGNNPDIIRVTHEKKNLLSVDEIRDEIVRDIYIKPFQGPYKIYIVEDACLMPEEAQNALLKTLEEPPSYAVIFLLADNASLLLDTIKSRSIRLDMEALSRKTIEAELMKKGVSKEEAAKDAAFCRGNLGQALEIAQDPEESAFLKYAADFLSDIEHKDAEEIFKAGEEFSAQSDLNVLDILRKWFRDVLLLKAEAGGDLYFPSEKKALFKQAAAMSYENISCVFADLDEAAERLKYNVNPRAVYEALLLRIRKNSCRPGPAKERNLK